MPWDKPPDITGSKQVDDLVELTHRKLALHAFSRVISKSRVISGRFQNAHNFSQGSPDLSVPPEGQYSTPTASVSISGPYVVTYITNALVYAIPLEERYGAYSTTFAELEAGIL